MSNEKSQGDFDQIWRSASKYQSLTVQCVNKDGMIYARVGGVGFQSDKIDMIGFQIPINELEKDNTLFERAFEGALVKVDEKINSSLKKVG